jgi:hypothetical protein
MGISSLIAGKKDIMGESSVYDDDDGKAFRDHSPRRLNPEVFVSKREAWRVAETRNRDQALHKHPKVKAVNNPLTNMSWIRRASQSTFPIAKCIVA